MRDFFQWTLIIVVRTKLHQTIYEIIILWVKNMSDFKNDYSIIIILFTYNVKNNILINIEFYVYEMFVRKCWIDSKTKTMSCYV